MNCLYVPIQKETETENCAVYVLLGYDIDGNKDILGIWIGEGTYYWMQIMDDIEARGVEEVAFISMDSVPEFDEKNENRCILKDAVIHGCIGELVRKFIKNNPEEYHDAFIIQLKKVYCAPDLEAALEEFYQLDLIRVLYDITTGVWWMNLLHVEHLFKYESTLRNSLYMMNTIGAALPNLRDVEEKGLFFNEGMVMMALYLKVMELYKQWNKRPHSDWIMVREQLSINGILGDCRMNCVLS